ncbi:MAG: hypothetical protein WAU70_15485 [Flavobacteriales bacterium]
MKRLLFPILLLLGCTPQQPADPVVPASDSVAMHQDLTEPHAVLRADTVENGLEQLRTSDGRLAMEGYKQNGKRHGVWTSYTQDRRVRSKNSYVDGELHGESVVFHENGQLYYTGSYEHGKEVGEWKFYGPDGALQKTVKH